MSSRSLFFEPDLCRCTSKNTEIPNKSLSSDCVHMSICQTKCCRNSCIMIKEVQIIELIFQTPICHANFTEIVKHESIHVYISLSVVNKLQFTKHKLQFSSVKLYELHNLQCVNAKFIISEKFKFLLIVHWYGKLFENFELSKSIFFSSILQSTYIRFR